MPNPKPKKDKPLRRKQFTLTVRAITSLEKWNDALYKANLQKTLEERIVAELAEVNRIQIGNTQWLPPMPTANGLILIKAVAIAINKP